MLKDKLVGKKTSLAEQRALAGTQGKKRVYDLWKKGQATQEDYKDVVRLCRENIRRAKAQLELNLATVIKGNKKCFCKYISNKRRAKENLHPLLDAEGNIVTEDEEKADVLNAFLLQSLIVRPAVVWVHSPLSWKTGMGSRMKSPLSKGKWLVTCYTT